MSITYIDITSPKDLPKDKEFYLFDDEKDLSLISEPITIYRLTRKIKKEYIEWYVMKETK